MRRDVIALPPALQRVLDETRQRFITTFETQCDSLDVLIDGVGTLGPSGPVAELLQATHRLSGLAGTIGFPTISARAAELEMLVRAEAGAFNPSLARGLLTAIRAAFATDLETPSEWALPELVIAQGATILIAEDEADQRAIVTACLAGAGYRTIEVTSGDLVVATARAERPALILLDIALPRLDGYSVCRLLKADPQLARIPVVFMTTGGNLDDRLTGLSLGADEFLSKPVDMRELLLRIHLLLERTRTRPSPAAAPCLSRELPYDAFLAAAREALGRSAAALGVTRVAPDRHKEAAALLAQEIRGRDTLGAYGPGRILILMPELTARAASDRLDPVVELLAARGLLGVHVGIAAAAHGQPESAEALIAKAEDALAEARYRDQPIAVWSADAPRARPGSADQVVVVAEDDPDVVRIIEAQLRAAGFKSFVAFDGEQALAAVRTHAADLLILDLMMPKLSGFEVLTQLRGGTEPRPRIIVVSGRGREQDVVRAFELGADDYMTKPFNPQELMARLVRMLK